MSSYNIPKKIHYCWFGGKPLPDFAKEYIKSWKKHCPDYEIIQWDESNVDINKYKFMKDAYKSKKWAFVSDYARYKVIYENGGIYLDVDVELIKNLDDLLINESYMGFENVYINTGLGFGAVKGSKIVKEIIDYYDTINFDEHKDNVNAITTPIIVTDILKSKGLVANGEYQKVDSVTILPEDYLCPKNPLTRIINITNNSYSIHHYDASWVDDKERKYINKLEEQGKINANKYPDLVSIIIPVYNGADYVRQAIDSALNQTYKNIEVLVIDDGSSDSTEEIAKSYGQAIRYIKKENGGVASALNTGIAKMRGKYFSWLSHDDEYCPNRVELLIKRIKTEKPKTIVISDWDIIDKNGAHLRYNKLDDRLETMPKCFLAFDRKTWLNACAMLIPRELFDKVGFFDESLKTTQDYDMHKRLMDIGARYKIVHEALFLSRQHANQGSLIENNVLQMSDNMHKNIITDLTNDEILKYFEYKFSEIEEVYNSFLNSGYKQTPALIMSRLLKILNHNDSNLTLKSIVNKKLIDINKSNTVTDINDLIKLIGSKKNKKRILFTSGYWRTGGMERVLSNLFKELSNYYDIILLTPYEDNNVCIKVPSGVKHILMSAKLYQNHFDTIGLSYALALEIDVVIGFLNLNKHQLDLYLQCKENGIKTIASNHEYYFYPYTSRDLHIRLAAEKRYDTFSQLDAVLWLTNFSTEVHNIDNDNGYLMHNPNTYPVQSIKQNKEKIVLAVGRFNDYVKRVDRILYCFNEVYKNAPDAKLVLVGKVNTNSKLPDINLSINEMIHKLGIPTENIEFVGETSDVHQYYKQARVYIMTSMSEGFPMTLTEASCFGVPIVCNAIPGIEDIIEDGVNGYIVPQDDIIQTSKLICDILIDNNLYNKLSLGSVELAKRFDAKKISKKWKILIDTIGSTGTQNDKKSLLKNELNSHIKDRTIIEKSLMSEINASFVCSNKIVVNSIGRTYFKEDSGNRYKRMIKTTIREYRQNGTKIVFHKASKKMARKSRHEAGKILRISKKISTKFISK